MTIRSVTFIPRYKLKEIVPTEQMAVISIRNTEADESELEIILPEWMFAFERKIIQYFDDCEPYKDDVISESGWITRENFMDAENPHQMRLFSDKDALEIISFVHPLFKDEKEYDILVHCVAGRCRSGAIARFICESYPFVKRGSLLKSHFQDDKNANIYILNKLRTVYFKYLEV